MRFSFAKVLLVVSERLQGSEPQTVRTMIRKQYLGYRKWKSNWIIFQWVVSQHLQYRTVTLAPGPPLSMLTEAFLTNISWHRWYFFNPYMEPISALKNKRYWTMKTATNPNTSQVYPNYIPSYIPTISQSIYNGISAIIPIEENWFFINDKWSECYY